MKYEDSKLLIKWAQLQAQIAAARNPVIAMNVEGGYVPVTKTVGFRKLRDWFAPLSDRAKAGARRMFKMQIEGVAKALAEAKRLGIKPNLADITIETRDTETGEPIGPHDLPEAVLCPASGGGNPGVTDETSPMAYVQCPKCLMRWSAWDIGFKIPNHEPLT